MRWAALALLALASCGGGGGSTASGTITPAGMLRNDLLFGYYGQTSPTVVESEGHTNLLWAPDFAGPLDQMAGLTQAKAAGMKAVVAIPLCAAPLEQGEGEARAWLQRLHDAGLLEPVVAISWCDEPNTPRSGAWTDAAATAMNAAIRRAMAAFPELHAALAVVYACTIPARPGAAAFDWVGCDDYDSGCTVLAPSYPGVTLRAGQRLLVLPGGADPWRQDPACFLSFAERDSRVVAIVPFLWQTVTDTGTTYRGIRENGLRTLYCQAGRTATAPGQPDGCA